MKAPRSQSRRDFTIKSAGYFSVLTTAPRTVTLRPSGGYRSLTTLSTMPGTSPVTPAQHAERLRTMKIPLIRETRMVDRGLVRMALIVLGAAAFTLFILWWMMLARH